MSENRGIGKFSSMKQLTITYYGLLVSAYVKVIAGVLFFIKRKDTQDIPFGPTGGVVSDRLSQGIVLKTECSYHKRGSLT